MNSQNSNLVSVSLELQNLEHRKLRKENKRVPKNPEDPYDRILNILNLGSILFWEVNLFCSSQFNNSVWEVSVSEEGGQ